MTDNPSNPPNPGVTRRAPRNRIWKDPSFWKGFLLGTGKGKIRGLQLGYWEVS